MSLSVELVLVWVAVGLYLVAGLASCVSVLWRRPGAARLAAWALAAALLVHAVPIAGRWARVGHGPYYSAYEVLSSSVWVGAAVLLGVAARFPAARAAIGPDVGISVLLMGWAILSSPEVRPLPATFKGVWLVIHIAFAKLAYGSILVATGIAAVRLWRGSAPPEVGDWQGQLAGAPPALDDLAARLVAFGFVALSFMIAAGSLWAHNAWGRYWSWDPTETWSLVTWIAYGLFLHLRMARRLSARGADVAVLALMVVSILAFFFVVRLLPTVHTEFMVK